MQIHTGNTDLKRTCWSPESWTRAKKATTFRKIKKICSPLSNHGGFKKIKFILYDPLITFSMSLWKESFNTTKDLSVTKAVKDAKTCLCPHFSVAMANLEVPELRKVWKPEKMSLEMWDQRPSPSGWDGQASFFGSGAPGIKFIRKVGIFLWQLG